MMYLCAKATPVWELHLILHVMLNNKGVTGNRTLWACPEHLS